MELRLSATLSEYKNEPCFKDEKGRLWNFTGEIDKQGRSRVTILRDYPTRYIIEGVVEETPHAPVDVRDVIVLISWTDIDRYMKEFLEKGRKELT